MGQLDDLELNNTSPPDPGLDRTGSGLWIVVAAALAVLAAAGGYYLLQREPQNEVAPAATAATRDVPDARRGPGEPGEDIVLPPLDQSDAVVRQLVGRLSAHPAVAAWLATDGLVRNFTVVTVNIAGGVTPVRHLRRLSPSDPFLIRGIEPAQTIDPRSYARYDAYADAVGALDARGTARLYATLKPRIEEAYRDLGEPAKDFDEVLERAIVELLRVPVVNDPVRVTPKPLSYAYLDTRLESLSPAQKQLLRMGPNNVAMIQRKLREIADYLGIPAAHLPPG
jgi:hypothetical protein